MRGLSDGFSEDKWISEVAAPILGELLLKVVWPSDFATLDGTSMCVRETTYRFSPLSFHKITARRRMLLTTPASGRAYLAFCDEEERQCLLDRLAAEPDSPLREAGARAALETLLALQQRTGHAWNNVEWMTERKILAIALPVSNGERVAGGINVVMMRPALTLTTARRKFLPPLQEAAQRIEDYLASARGAEMPRKKASEPASSLTSDAAPPRASCRARARPTWYRSDRQTR